ncbi:MAG: NAD(P)-dependent oxidoreductase [Candidatus Levybacteria bacterium]|nr:NAD(P)-dependent oxidoreductase [Candidatus Levybacteria bacterium]
MNILVTGGAGYLGSVLVGKLLAENNKVRVLDALMFGGEGILPFIYHKNFEFVKGDTRNKETVLKSLEGVDCVFHLAALVGEPACSVNPSLTEQINHESAVLVGKSAKENGVERIIFTSTCSNYGISNLDELATEESPLNPLSLYAETKIATEKDLLELSDSSFTVCVLRLATIFGLSGRMRFNLLINEMVREAYVNKKILLYKEDAWRPYAHTQDASDALISVLNAESSKINHEIFNMGTENYQKKGLVELVKKYVPDLEIDRQGGLPDNRDYKVSFEKIKRVIGFTPKRKVADGVDELFWAVKNNVFSNLYDDRYVSWINEKVLDKL